MAEILKVSRWRRRSVDYYGAKVPFEFRALNKREAAPFLKRLVGTFSISVDETQPQEDQAAQAERIFEERCESAFVKELFSDFVRLPEPFDLDGTSIETAQQALEEGDPPFMLAIIGAFHLANSLSRDEGNASGSPSASVPAAGLDGSNTDATATESADSPAA